MIVQKCSLCGDAQREPLTWAVCAWIDAQGERHSFKHKLCVECVASLVAPVHVASERVEMLCPNCGIETSDNYDAIYGTFIPKGVGKFRFAAPFCPPCALVFRNRWTPGALKLPDRGPDIRDRLATEARTDNGVWAALGIQPRD